MAQSYVPHKAYITCTEMKSPTPVQLYYSRSTVNIINFNNNKAPLLTVGDKKLSNSLNCKITSKFWGGFSKICMVIAIGALAIAAVAITVGTGGAALPLIIAGAALLGGGVASYKEVAHDCDVTLESKWLNYHDTVNFNGYAALIKSSNMLCNKGGALNIMLGKALAYSAAGKISQLNIQEYNAHLDSQSIQSFLMLISTKGDPKALAVAGPLTIFNYVSGEGDKEQTRKDNMEKTINKEEVQKEDFFDKLIGDSPTSARDAVIGAATDADVLRHGIVPSSRVLWEMGKYTTTAAVRGTPGAYIRLNNALMLTIGENGFKKLGGNLLEGFGWGMAGAAVDAGYDVHEDTLHEEATDIAFVQRDKDSESHSLTIISGSK